MPTLKEVVAVADQQVGYVFEVAHAEHIGSILPPGGPLETPQSYTPSPDAVIAKRRRSNSYSGP